MYNITVNWGSSAAEHSTWSFSGSFDSRGVLSYNNCTKTTSTFDQAGNESRVTNYTNGSGYIQMANGGLTWYGNQEGDNAGTIFIK